MLFCASTMISCGDDPQSTGCPEDPDVPQLYSIALTDDGATVTVGGKEADEAEAGTTVTATASPAEGYLFDMWSAETGDVIFAAATAAATTFIMPAGDVAIEARFKTIPVAEKYTLTITAGDGGDAVATVDGREISEAEEGTTITLTATPDEGYLFVAWASETPNVTFADPTNASTTFEMPSSGVTVTAEFIIEVTEIDVLDNIADANFRSYCRPIRFSTREMVLCLSAWAYIWRIS